MYMDYDLLQKIYNIKSFVGYTDEEMYCYKQGRMLKRQLISLWYMPIMKLAE